MVVWSDGWFYGGWLVMRKIIGYVESDVSWQSIWWENKRSLYSDLWSFYSANNNKNKNNKNKAGDGVKIVSCGDC